MGFIKRRARRLVKQNIRNPAKVAMRRASSRWCPECQQVAPMLHLCSPKSDFKRHTAQATRKTKDARNGATTRRPGDAKEPRRTSATRTRTSRRDQWSSRGSWEQRRGEAGKHSLDRALGSRSHDYHKCNDESCVRPICVAFKEGMTACPLSHI